MATLLSGRDVAAAMLGTLAERAERLRARGVTPALAIVRVGARPDDIAYENAATRRCERFGIAVQSVALPETASEAALLAAIEQINAARDTHGCLLLRPLPKRFNENRVRNAIRVEKDVDGVTDGSLAGVFAGAQTGYPPCTAQACMEMLSHYGVDVAGKNAVVIGRSLVVGKPVSMLLLQRNATVTICHTKSVDLPRIARGADILIVAAGSAGVVGKDCVSPGQTVLDVGVHVNADGTLTGDVRFMETEPIAGAITPVPGGVGAVTTSVLAKHVLEAAERSLDAF